MRRWTEEDLKYLKRWINKKGDRELSEHFGVTIDSLKCLLKRKGIKREERLVCKILQFKTKRKTGKHYRHLEKPCKICISHRKNEKGYVWVTQQGHSRVLHRVLWEEANGPVPKGLILRHKCDEPACCELTHLELGTYRDNTQDQIDRGRFAYGEKSGFSKLTKDKVRRIRKRLDENYSPELVKKLAERYGITTVAVGMIYRRKRWTQLDPTTENSNE